MELKKRRNYFRRNSYVFLSKMLYGTWTLDKLEENLDPSSGCVLWAIKPRDTLGSVRTSGVDWSEWPSHFPPGTVITNPNPNHIWACYLIPPNTYQRLTTCRALWEAPVWGLGSVTERSKTWTLFLKYWWERWTHVLYTQLILGRRILVPMLRQTTCRMPGGEIDSGGRYLWSLLGKVYILRLGLKG